jgi:hypothetical protein
LASCRCGTHSACAGSFGRGCPAARFFPPRSRSSPPWSWPACWPRRRRPVGFNAPEISSAACTTERKLGVRAQQRLREIARNTPVSLQRVACACAPGTEGTSRCNYGRLCGVMTSNGVDVGTVLIGEGLAVPYFCGATHCPPKPRPWCG